MLGKIYDDNYKAILDPSAWVEYKAKAESKGIHIEDKFANFVEKAIYNPKGTDFETLNNAIKTINSYHKDALDPNFRDFVRNSAERFLKDDIKKGIDNIFAQNPTAYNYARDLFDTALNDYATMKSTLKIADKLKLRDEAVSYERALENLQKYASGQGKPISRTNEALENAAQYKVLDQKQAIEDFALSVDLRANATPLPKEINIDDFLKTLDEVGNKENFIAHFQGKADAKARLAYLNLVEPTLKQPDIKLFTGAKERYIKTFKDDKGELFYLLATQDNGKTLLTGIKTRDESYIRGQIKNADLIQTFTGRGSKDFDNKTAWASNAHNHITPKPTAQEANGLLRFARNDEIATQEPSLSTAIRNLSKLTKSIGEENRARVEIQLLNDIFQKSLYEAQELAVFDSKAFFKKIDSIGESSFLSPQAKEFITIAKGFDSLFQNDVRLARLLAPASPDKIGSSIATTIEGAVKFQAVKMLFEQVVRLMPQIPFLRGLNEKIQGAAVRHHLRSALSKSVEVSDFKFQLRDKIARAPINTPTKDLLSQILGEVEKGEAKIAKATTQAQNATDLQTYNTLRAYDVEDLHLASKQEYEKFVDDVISGDIESLKNAPNILHIANLDKELSSLLNLENAKAFLRKNDLHHFRPDRKAKFGQTISAEEIKEIPSIISEAKSAYVDKEHRNFMLVKQFGDDEFLYLHFNKDELGNYIVTAKKGKGDFTKGSDFELVGTGVEPAIQREASLTPQSTSFLVSPIQQANHTTPKPTTQDSLFTRALQEKQAQIKEAEQRLAKEQELAESKARELAKLHADIIAQKQAIAGLAANERVLNIGESIPMQKVENLPSTSIAINENEIYPLDFVIVKKQDLKPNFNASDLQGRTEANTHTIQDIANNFNPQKILGRGGFQDLPIIRKDGAIISGNHRTQGMLEFSQESRAAYENAIKEQYGITLKNDELLMRTPKNLSAQDELNLAFLSNKDNLDNLGDKALASLGKYDKAIKDIPNQIQSESVDELSAKVAKLLEKDNAYPDIESTNLALLSHLAKNSNGRNIAEVLNSLSRLEPTDRVKIKDMFVKNAGELHNLCNQAASHKMQSLELRPYLLDSISASANALTHTRAENFERLAKDIKALLDTTDKNGTNAMLETMPSVYKDTLGELLGASLARFVRLENPAGSLYEVLKDAPAEIAHMIEPALFNQGGKALKDADIYDFIEYLIRTGERSEATSSVIEMLPKLREKQRLFESGAKEGVESGSQNNLRDMNLNTAKTSQIRKALANELKGVINQEITNKNDSAKVRLGMRGLNKILSDKAIKKSINNGFTREEHIRAAGNIKEIFEDAKPIKTLEDKKQRQDIKAFHQYANEKDNAIITIKESVQNGKRIYSLELMELKNAPLTQRQSPTSQEAIGFAHTRNAELQEPALKQDTHRLLQSVNDDSTTPKPTAQTNAPTPVYKDTPTPQKILNMSEVKIDSLDNLGKWAEVVGIRFADEKEAKMAQKYLQSRLKDLEC